MTSEAFGITAGRNFVPSFMAARPRWRADLLAAFEADEDDDDTRRADRWPAGRDDDALLRSPAADGTLASPDDLDATVDVPVVELPADRAAQAFGRLLASEASCAAGPPRGLLRQDSEIRAPAFFFRDGELEASGAAHGAETLSSLANSAAATCEDDRGRHVAWAVDRVEVHLRPIGFRAGFEVTVEGFAMAQMKRMHQLLSRRRGFGFREGLRRRRRAVEGRAVL